MTKQDVKQMDAQKQEATAVHKNVYCALIAAQKEMGPLVKGSENPHFKSKYADLADLVMAVRDPLNRHGLAYFHQVVADGDGRSMRTILVHGESEQHIECDVPLIVQKNDMQGMKSATTYAKRIGLESVTGVAPEDDDGNAAAKAAPEAIVPRTASWADTVLQDLPPNASPRDKAEEIAKALCSQFQRMKGERQIGNEWDRRAPIIASLEEKHPDLHETVCDAYENRLEEIKSA